MSRDPAVSSGFSSEDIWTKLQKERNLSLSNGVSAANQGNSTTATEKDGGNAPIGGVTHQQVIFVGDASSGKSTLIQTFIKPNAAKDTKPTVSLDYNFARKTVNNTKLVANLWEVGGDFVEGRYLEIPITKDSLTSSTIVLTCDLSKPHNVTVSILRSLSAIREVLKRRITELQATNVLQLNELKERIASQYKGHVDANRVKPTEVPIVIVANKFDAMRAMPIGERRILLQAIRFIAHYFGAVLLTVSSNDSVTRDLYRNLMNAICFNPASLRPSNEANIDKYVYITRGQDSFEQILISNVQSSSDSSSADAAKYRLIVQESEFDQFVTNKGVTRDCWNRLTDHLANVFGEPDPLPTLSITNEQKEIDSGGDPEDENNNNPFPETEVDEMRTVRGIALQRFVQEMERRQETLAKMNARNP